jgi:hypothetical protein
MHISHCFIHIYVFLSFDIQLLVTCHFWYLFVDQLRLAFAPNSVDEEFAVVSL